jgi:hypothetical protein
VHSTHMSLCLPCKLLQGVLSLESILLLADVRCVPDVLSPLF